MSGFVVIVMRIISDTELRQTTVLERVPYVALIRIIIFFPKFRNSTRLLFIYIHTIEDYNNNSDIKNARIFSRYVPSPMIAWLLLN